MYLKEIKTNYNLPYFPEKWQAVLFRNYGLVPVERLAEILETDIKTIKTEAERIGISKIKYNDKFLTNGYITIIKNNWYILPYDQIRRLLGWTEEYFDFILKEDDFLDVKLGNYKPDVEKVIYKPLSEKGKAVTEEIKKTITEEFIEVKEAPFSFYNDEFDYERADDNFSIGERIIYNYSSLYGDCLMNETDSTFPDKLLLRLSELNINGIWMQGVLSKLSYYPFDPTLSEGYKIRRQNLNKLIERCKRYGIKIYLYMNEPRSLPLDKFENGKIPKGQVVGNFASICSHSSEMHDYLYNAVGSLCEEVIDLGGIIAISMSENLTNCFSVGEINCPTCKNLLAEREVPEVMNTMMRAIKDKKSHAKLIAYIWQWDKFLDKSVESLKKAFSVLDKDIEVMCVSENRLEFTKQGIKNVVIDYSISNVGPSEKTIRYLTEARKQGHKILAKVQIANSWECATVPYIPVFNLIDKHLKALKELKVSGLMLSWTMGSYPSLTFDLARCYYGNKITRLDDWYKMRFHKNWQIVSQAVNDFSLAFTQFPFDIQFIYNGPVNKGCANLWQAEPYNLDSTMIGFPFDRIDQWKGVYPQEVLVKQMDLLCDGWKKGIDKLNTIKNPDVNTKEVLNMAKVCYIQFESSRLQMRFAINKGKKGLNRENISLIEREMSLVREMYKIMSSDSRIGFEPSNHYFFTANNLLEKIINLKYIKEMMKE